MKTDFPSLDIVEQTSVDSLMVFFEELQAVVRVRRIGWLDFTEFDPPIPSCETSPEVLEVLRVEFSCSENPEPDEVNIFGFFDNEHADGLYLNSEIENVIYHNRPILRKGRMPFVARPADHMRWADACAITLSYFELHDQANRGGWHPERRKEAFRKAWEVFALTTGADYHRRLSAQDRS